MDPTETLAQLLIAIHERDSDAMREHCENLAEWIERGGFAPDLVQAFERADATARADCADVIAALRAIADPNKLDASRSPLPDNLARLALSWLAARPEFENARAVLRGTWHDWG